MSAVSQSASRSHALHSARQTQLQQQQSTGAPMPAPSLKYLERRAVRPRRRLTPPAPKRGRSLRTSKAFVVVLAPSPTPVIESTHSCLAVLFRFLEGYRGSMQYRRCTLIRQRFDNRRRRERSELFLAARMSRVEEGHSLVVTWGCFRRERQASQSYPLISNPSGNRQVALKKLASANDLISTIQKLGSAKPIDFGLAKIPNFASLFSASCVGHARRQFEP